MQVKKYDSERGRVEGALAPKGLDRTQLDIPARKGMAIAGLLLLTIAIAVAFVFTYQALFLFYIVYMIFIFITYLVLWTDEVWKSRLPKKLPSDWPMVSIIIPSYNAGHTIFKCIESCKAMEYDGKTEIIVVDDGSKDGSDAEIAKMHGVTLIRKPRNEGKAAALNTGIGQAKGKFIACIDSDTYPEKLALKKLIPYFYEDAKVGSVTLFINTTKPANFLQAMQEIEYWVSFGFFFKTVEAIEGLYVTPGPVSIYRKEVFEELGGYDVKNIGEDMEIALRLQRHGWKIRICSSAIAYTEVPATLKSLYVQRLRWVRGSIMNVLKYADMFFNSKYSYFGLFVMPIVLFNSLFAALFTFWTLLNVGKNMLNVIAPWFSNFAAVAPFAVQMPQLDVYLLDSTVVFGAVSLSIFAYFVWMGFKLSHRKPDIEHIIPLIGMLVFYPFFLGITYFMAYVKEFSAQKYKW